ncbi:DUF859 family phage minor structural protein [Bacillus sonorensis]|uniref:DUF859 family phage minor structural protein n=1 Tax=Bacillus sonorensis TaxID=119858 RepID=UPI002DB8B1C9|nr:DUF859 family phage minor structural protein [Bacillus sonorensis]MEC1440575.1 DUF859 family phage minor structural protein [Bacillus sonorensis]
MALSGTIYTNVGSHWRLQLEWTGSQSTSGNYTDVTAKLYWIARDSYGAVDSGATKSCGITVSGSTSTKSASGMSKLSGNQKKLIHSYTKRINHNSDGTGSVTLDGYLNAEVTLGGTYYGKINLSAKTWTLNTIPRASSLSSSPSWKAGSNFTLSVSRASSSFSHEAEIYVKDTSGNWEWIKRVDFSKSQTSLSSAFSTENQEEIFQVLAGRNSANSRILLQTFNGSTMIGQKEYIGTCTAPSASTISSSTDREVYIDQTISLGITRHNSGFSHTIKIFCGGTLIKTITGVGTSTSWTPTQAEKDIMYGKTPNSNEIDGNIEVYTYYGSQLVRSYTNNDIDFHVRNSNPTFSGNYSYKDTNATTTGITENDQYIIQNKSSVLVEIPSTAKATPLNGASMVEYEAKLGGKTIKRPYSSSSTVSFDFGEINANTNQTLTISAIDSRGNRTTTTKTVNMVPYSNPNVSATAKRINDFENNTVITLMGSVSPLNVGGSNKNAVLSMKYEYKLVTSSSYPTTGPGSPTSFSSDTSKTFPKYGGVPVVVDLNNLSAWNVRITVSDKLGSTTVVKTVDTGKPIFFIDSIKKSLGFNDFPLYENEFRFNGRIVFGANQWAPNSQGEGAGALYLNNSDITGVNGVWFNDIANNDGEGLLFLKSGSTTGSTTPSDYDNFLIRDGIAYLNGQPVLYSGNEELWNGAYYMHSGHTIYPTKKISDCPNGWVLVWSDYDKPTKTVNDFNFAYTFIHKYHVKVWNGGGVYCPIGTTRTTITNKYLYIYNDKIVGNDDNDDDDTYASDAVLRKVLCF